MKSNNIAWRQITLMPQICIILARRMQVSSFLSADELIQLRSGCSWPTNKHHLSVAAAAAAYDWKITLSRCTSVYQSSSIKRLSILCLARSLAGQGTFRTRGKCSWFYLQIWHWSKLYRTIGTFGSDSVHCVVSETGVTDGTISVIMVRYW